MLNKVKELRRQLSIFESVTSWTSKLKIADLIMSSSTKGNEMVKGKLSRVNFLSAPVTVPPITEFCSEFLTRYFFTYRKLSSMSIDFVSSLTPKVVKVWIRTIPLQLLILTGFTVFARRLIGSGSLIISRIKFNNWLLNPTNRAYPSFHRNTYYSAKGVGNKIVCSLPTPFC